MKVQIGYGDSSIFDEIKLRELPCGFGTKVADIEVNVIDINIIVLIKIT